MPSSIKSMVLDTHDQSIQFDDSIQLSATRAMGGSQQWAPPHVRLAYPTIDALELAAPRGCEAPGAGSAQLNYDVN